MVIGGIVGGVAGASTGGYETGHAAGQAASAAFFAKYWALVFLGAVALSGVLSWRGLLPGTGKYKAT
jgi:hypothetical protein